MSKMDSGTVGKAMEVLDLVASFQRPVRFAELQDKSPFPKATLYRLVQTLTQQSILQYDDATRAYAPGLRLVRLAHAAWAQSSIAPIARPVIDDLAASLGETVHLAQLENGQVLFIDKRRSSGSFDTLAQTGQVAPAYCTGVGKAILAHLPPEAQQIALNQQAYFSYTPNTHRSPETLRAELSQIRASGVAYDREEHQTGIISIAAPILVQGTRVIGALSVATSTTRHAPEGLEAFRDALLRAARSIGTEAAAWQFPDAPQARQQTFAGSNSLGGEP